MVYLSSKQFYTTFLNSKSILFIFKFEIQETVSKKKVLKMLNLLVSKKSYGRDGISSEILKLGANVLVIPLTYITL